MVSEALRRIQAGSRLEIIRSARRLNHYSGDQMVKKYPVAVGKPATPTPLGIYKVVNKVVNPGGMLGTRWMGLNIPGGNYGIHGNNNPSSIGTFASHGCIRMFNKDVEELFPVIGIGTPVIISDSGDPDVQETQAGKENSGRRTYVIQAGDTLWNISKTFGVPLDDIIRANSISNPDILVPGQVLIIP